MRALIFEGPNRLNLQEVPRPEPADGEVLIRVHSAAICGSDVRIVEGSKTRDVRQGHPIGHEAAGTVAAVGEGVTDYSIGERVAVCVVVSCGRCGYCLSDRENLCETRATLGYHTDGSFAEYMLIPAHAVSRGNLFKLPDNVAMEYAPLIEPMACCLNGQHEMELFEQNGAADGPKTESLVIFGAGPIGLVHLMLARARSQGSLREITVVEPQSHRREYAMKFGANTACSPDEFDAADRFDAAILAVGVPDVVPLALKALRKCGRLSLFAGFAVGASAVIDPNAIHYKQIRVFGASESGRSDFAEAMSLMAEGKIDPSPLVTHRFALADYEAAFRTAADGSALKVMFDMPG